MEQDVLSPTVQHGSETDFRSQMPGSGGEFLQGPGDRSEQDIKKEGLVAESEGIQFVRKGEDEVEVGKSAGAWPAVFRANRGGRCFGTWDNGDRGRNGRRCVAGRRRRIGPGVRRGRRCGTAGCGASPFSARAKASTGGNTAPRARGECRRARREAGCWPLGPPSFSPERWLRERRVSPVGCGCGRGVPE